ncbi:MAG: hypothetical protein IKZ53_01010 [Selenomonadaceae bacterium]|nr:hypothetical protein [Selenomonadaceae bacterium]
MGFFDTLKVMKDIVSGGIASYKAGEKLDELIEKVIADYGEELSTAQEKLYLKYDRSKKAYNDNSDSEKTNELLNAMENDRVAFLRAINDNDSIPKALRKEISDAIEEFNKADNLALNSLSNTLEKYAENDEQREEIRKVVDESKRK